MLAEPGNDELENLWAHQNAQWRDGAQITSQWEDAALTDTRLLQFDTYGNWWQILEETNSTILLTREYEHLIMGLSIEKHQPLITYMRLPHPSGLVVDKENKQVYVASTRNPNQVFTFSPVTGMLLRQDVERISLDEIGFVENALTPKNSFFLPGCFYIHDLALICGKLFANSVGQNLVIGFGEDGQIEHRWWPLCVEQNGKPLISQNFIQLNSIAAGNSIEESFFSASTDKISTRRPGHQNFTVDKKGVVFSGITRLPVVRGLTRPHSARLHNGQIYIDNSGYGELVLGNGENPEVIAPLPGWTRGLAISNDIAFVGSSRVLSRFVQYAPGLVQKKTVCGLHAVSIRSGEVLAGIIWPYGNQIFAVDLMPRTMSAGFPIIAGKKRASKRERIFYYAYNPNHEG
jgi:uncharacterized protein (TIGR03032 family)